MTWDGAVIIVAPAEEINFLSKLEQPAVTAPYTALEQCAMT